MLQKKPQNRKRKTRRIPAAKGKANAQDIHSSRMKLASLSGLILGSLVCAALFHFDTWLPTTSPIQLTVTSQVAPGELTGEETQQGEDEEGTPQLRGPERVIDVSQIHPALGKVVDNQHVQDLPENHSVTFTVNPRVQARAEKILSDNDVPYGAVVALDPRNGKIIAFADYQSELGLHTGFALEASQPAASVFKVISTAALMEKAGISPKETVCYHGGKRGISKRELIPNAKRDSICRNLGDALAHSSNVVFARLADKHLSPESLTDAGNRFGFNSPIPFLWTVEESRLALPQDRVEFAGSAAGFHHSYMSPLHGAMLTAAVANGGSIPFPHLVERIERDGMEIYSAEALTIGDAIAESTGKQLAEMMTRTTTKGTAAKYFNKRHRVLNDIKVAGKTGSLSSTIGGKRRHNSWFVAFAPADNPQIALAALVVNDPKWRIKSTFLGREILEEFFISQKGQK